LENPFEVYDGEKNMSVTSRKWPLGGENKPLRYFAVVE